MFVKKCTRLFGVLAAILISFFLAIESVHAAPLEYVPVTVTQPDGTVLELFASGDEYYNWLHDAEGYTIMQDPDTGYYVYADLVGGVLVPTKSIAGLADPAAAGLEPNLNISASQKEQIRQEFLTQTEQLAGEIHNAPKTGTITNLVIFVRFSGEAEFGQAASVYTDMLNSAVPGANSMRNYYLEASYNQLTINSSLLPTPGANVVSYQDSHPRGYYRPYNATTNTIGYTGGPSGTQRAQREHTLLRDAINYVNGLGQFPSGATIDADNDGGVDSLAFVVSGSPDGWSELLWPHQWSLFTYSVSINGKSVSRYQFQLQNVINNGVWVHETFHVLGAPDLYRYSGGGFQPVGSWDVMERDLNPPQHMSCYLKYKHGNWITLPVISAAGSYTLNPATSSTNNCFKIASPYSSTEFFVVEYRNKTGGSIFEASLPGTGLLVYRINTAANGNGSGPPDEVYVYRPGGTTTVNGTVNNANFSSDVGRTAINDSTSPSSFLSDGSAGGLDLCNIGASGATISFSICASGVYAISGNAGAADVVLSYDDGGPKTVTSGADGLYSIAVPAGWSGTVTPSKPGYTFSPPNRPYTNVTTNQTGQDYTATTGLTPDGYEPDNSPAQAKTISAGVPQTHNITPATDVDWVTFTLTSASDVILETSGATGADTRMWLFESSDLVNAYDFNDDKDATNGNLYSYLAYDCEPTGLPAGTYYVAIDEYGNDNAIPEYEISLTATACDPPVTPDSYEPDNSPAQAKAISSGIPQDHNIAPATDVDWMIFTLGAPAAVTLETTGTTIADTRMWLFTSSDLGNPYDFNDDKDYEGGDYYSYLTYVCNVNVLPAGTYYIAIDEYGNNDEIPDYQLSLTATVCSGPDSYEPDDSTAQAKVITSGAPQTHNLAPVGDVDWMTFTLTTKSTVILETSGTTVADTEMWLFRSSDLINPYDFNDDKDFEGGDYYSYLAYTNCQTNSLPAGTYYVAIDEYGNDNEIPDYQLSLTATGCGTAASFSDVSINYWAWDFIERLYSAGITGGCLLSPPQYCPEQSVTRAQMAVFLLRGIHTSAYAPPTVGADTGFADIPPGYWSAAWIKQLAAEGITSGCGNSNYCPEQPVTRAQMAVFLVRTFGLP